MQQFQWIFNSHELSQKWAPEFLQFCNFYSECWDKIPEIPSCAIIGATALIYLVHYSDDVKQIKLGEGDVHMDVLHK